MINKKMTMILPLPPSVNAAYANNRHTGRGRILTPAAENWKLVAGYAAKQSVRNSGWQITAADEKVVLELVAFWPDNRRRDMNNLHKLLCDALEGVVYPDDKMVLVRDMDFSIDRKRSRLEVCVHVKDD
ncbi:RusA family crossover junction endodeoxyribonuclease [uncultured Phascolarctobacterium sp.]|uniref:RusA family crossover junction endodeoxyribonuclease n=1 Tax=uncultured Phascolarctobacterium sp. TaxID=512296 RepID=UPI00262F7953|nr:RusA family crossover junction endodeoxyribonuclease [uncultured Phascolarctobacterium sp.]